MTIYPTLGKFLGISLAKSNRIFYCIRLPIIPHQPYIFLYTTVRRKLFWNIPPRSPIFSSPRLVSPVFPNNSTGGSIEQSQKKILDKSICSWNPFFIKNTGGNVFILVLVRKIYRTFRIRSVSN